ncbi:MAG: hypothetical protein WBN68_18150, partial [Sedimenticolaceae bacterium]
MTQETLFAGMIFVVVLLMTQAFVTPVMGSRGAARRRLRDRVRALSTTSEGGTHAALVQKKRLQRLSPFERRLESVPFLTRLSAVLSHAGLDYPAYRIVAAGILLAAVFGLLAYARTENLVFASLASTLAGLSPMFYVQLRRRRRLRDFEEQLPDALSVVARSLKAGLPFTESIKMVSTEMD